MEEGQILPHLLCRSWTAEHLLMPGIIKFPKLVKAAPAQYGDHFANECQRCYFAKYLTGLFVSQRKTVRDIHYEFAQITDQYCLNRFLTAAHGPRAAQRSKARPNAERSSTRL